MPLHRTASISRRRDRARLFGRTMSRLRYRNVIGPPIEPLARFQQLQRVPAAIGYQLVQDRCGPVAIGARADDRIEPVQLRAAANCQPGYCLSWAAASAVPLHQACQSVQENWQNQRQLRDKSSFIRKLCQAGDNQEYTYAGSAKRETESIRTAYERQAQEMSPLQT